MESTATSAIAAEPETEAVVTLLELLVERAEDDAATARQCLAVVAGKIQSREIAGEQLAALRPRLAALTQAILSGKNDHPLRVDAALLAASWRDPAALGVVREILASDRPERATRIQALDCLIAAGDASVLESAERILAGSNTADAVLRAATLAALARLDDPKVADVALAVYPKLDANLQPKAVELLTARTEWSKKLLDAVGRGEIPAGALGVNQVRKLLTSKDEELVKAVRAKWGNIRSDRDPSRERVIAEMRTLIRGAKGDPQAGRAAFQKVCGQCHKLHGEGAEVGPDLTANGRGSFEQLLSNVFDPSLVIGAAYLAVTIRTADGRVLIGLPVEDGPQRVVLRLQGGKLETLPRDEIDVLQASKLSMMPEEVEKQLKPQEIVDL
ncbi:MAG: c-type cytochrome, partial [Pirellulales bacterium]